MLQLQPVQPVKQTSNQFRIRIARAHGVTVLRQGLSEAELKEWVDSFLLSSEWSAFHIEKE